MLLILFTSPIIEQVIFLNLNQITIKNFIYQSRYFHVFTDTNLWFVTWLIKHNDLWVFVWYTTAIVNHEID